MHDLRQILLEIEAETAPLRSEGKSAAYIPFLERVNPDRFGMCVHPLEGGEMAVGDQNIVKVFSLAMALGTIGRDVWKRVGMKALELLTTKTSVSIF